VIFASVRVILQNHPNRSEDHSTWATRVT